MVIDKDTQVTKNLLLRFVSLIDLKKNPGDKDEITSTPTPNNKKKTKKGGKGKFLLIALRTRG